MVQPTEKVLKVNSRKHYFTVYLVFAVPRVSEDQSYGEVRSSKLEMSAER